MMERKLASIRRIKEIKEIENADNIVLAVLDGWQAIVKKGEYSPGDLVTYCEIDSFLPVKDEYEFLRKSSYKNVEGLGEGFRIKTMKLRGTLSQGVVLPPVDGYSEGDDVTEALGIQLYEPPIPANLRGQVEGLFPHFVRKTDQERIQNVFDEYKEKYGDHQYEITLKVDGSSMTSFFNDGDTGVCSRNLRLKVNEENKDNSFVKMFLETGLEEKLKSIGKNVAIQGELAGPGIQKNKMNLLQPFLFIFDIFDINKQEYYTAEERYEFIINDLDVDIADMMSCDLNKIRTSKHMHPIVHCPVVDYNREDIFTSVEDILEMADMEKRLGFLNEGIVFKSLDDPSISFKAINNNYLLKEK